MTPTDTDSAAPDDVEPLSPLSSSSPPHAASAIDRLTTAARTCLSNNSHRQRKPRRPSLASVAKQARKAGIEVARYEVKPDNTVVVVIGEPESTALENPWLADLKVKQ